MDATPIGLTQKENREERIDEEHVFDGVVLFLTAITPRLFNRVLGADDPPFGAVMGKRGGAGAVARGSRSSSKGAMTIVASTSETPRRCAKAVRERAGASPRARSAARRQGRRT